MIRLTLRQFRASASTAYAVLAVIAIVVAITGPRLAHFYDTQVAVCHIDCGGVTNTLLGFYHAVQASLGPILLLLPALIGIFWGAPLLAHELESGTYRLAWTQSLTRGRWLAVKLALTGLAAVAAAGLLSLMVTWWFSPIDRVNANRFTPAMFGERGIVPIGYAAFALAFGVVAGLLIRRTVPAMAVTLVAYLAARLGVTYLVRPNLMAPVRATTPMLAAANNPGLPSPGDWVLSAQTINGAGQVIGANGGIGPAGNFGFTMLGNGRFSLQGVGLCPGRLAAHLSRTRQPNSFFQSCINHYGIRQLVTYQPISRYWAFQGLELAVFLGAALALAGFCFWWVRHRLA